MFSNLKLYVYIGIGIAFVVLSCALKYYVTRSSELSDELTIKTQELNDMKAAFVKLQDINQMFKKTNDELMYEQSKLQTKLSKFEFRINSIAGKHPKMLENAINKASNDVNTCLENISKDIPCK